MGVIRIGLASISFCRCKASSLQLSSAKGNKQRWFPTTFKIKGSKYYNFINNHVSEISISNYNLHFTEFSSNMNVLLLHKKNLQMETHPGPIHQCTNSPPVPCEQGSSSVSSIYRYIISFVQPNNLKVLSVKNCLNQPSSYNYVQ